MVWHKHEDNPVIRSDGPNVQAPRVLFDGSTWHMWYNTWDGSVAPVLYATSDCCAGVAGLTCSQFVPAAAFASGAAGSFYQTDLDLSNAASQPVQYQLMWLPRGETNHEPLTSETFTLDAGMSVRYANVLAEVFNLEPDALGALAILSSSPDLLAMGRIFNTPTGETAGTYGQAMTSLAPDSFVRGGETRRILFASENADMRTNIGCQNANYTNVVVELELYDMEGNLLDSRLDLVPAWGNIQLNQIFDEFRPITGYVDVSSRMPNGVIYCYGSVLDNVTSDPTTILPQ
jgi:hypothetical protein